ncbi:hypothetical protein AB0J47_41855 [Nocardia sp. NPDC049737]|uniref:hypothetical protein n=1 Tax=Nocardia sp. NPDC049737 TaxID=3154358 RepID=UPI003416A916
MIRTVKPLEWTDESWDWYRQEYQPEAARAARGHLFAAHLPAAALAWGNCSLTATEAVEVLGADIWQAWRGGSSWRWIADILDVPRPVAMIWAIESLIRRDGQE